MRSIRLFLSIVKECTTANTTSRNLLKMKIKKIVKLFLVVLVCTSNSDALLAQKYGIKAGLNLSNMRIIDNDADYGRNFDINPGFHLGATAAFPLTKIFSIETGLFLATRGYKSSEEEIIEGETYAKEARTNLLYLDIPVTAKASYAVGKAKLYVVFGPYASVGLSGRLTYDQSYNSATIPEDESVTWGSAEDAANFKRMDYGLAMGAGIAINAFHIGYIYHLGLANISPATANGLEINNRVLGVSVGYQFGGK